MAHIVHTYGGTRSDTDWTQDDRPPLSSSRNGRLHAKGYTLAHHLLSGSPRRSAHGGGTPGCPGESAVTRLETPERLRLSGLP